METKMGNFGETVFALHCPRCGFADWSEEEYHSGKNTYNKCLHCGADVCTDGISHIGIVVERPYYVLDANTYDTIQGTNGIKAIGWKKPSGEYHGK